MNGMGILEFDLEVEVLSRDNRVGLGSWGFWVGWVILGSGSMTWFGRWTGVKWSETGVKLGGVSVIV